MSLTRLPSAPPLSTPVAIVFFLLTNAVFYSTLGSFYVDRRLRHGQVVPAVITHKWNATRWGDEVYIGYAYDQAGVTHSGSARIRATGAALYRVGERLEVVVDREAPRRSTLRDRTHLSLMATISSTPGMVLLTGLFCLFGWWLFISRIRRRWREARLGARHQA